MTGVTTALLLPGARYGAQAPLLYYAAAACERRGVAVRRLDWSPPAWIAGGDDLDAGPAWVAAQVEPELARLDRPLLVGKSLGTFAAPLAARDALPAVWLTPLLRHDAVVAGLRAASSPVLLIGGTADPWWDAGRARSLGAQVHEVPGADHALMVGGPLADSARLLGEAADAIERFLDEVR